MIGTAQAAYDDYAAYLRDQVSTYNRSRVAEHVTVQLKLAEAAQMVDIARLLVREDWKEAQRLIARGAQLPLIDRARWRRNGAYAAGCCVKAVDLIHSVCGAQGQLPRQRPPAPAPRRPRGQAPDPPLLGDQRRRVRPHSRRPAAEQRAALGASVRVGSVFSVFSLRHAGTRSGHPRRAAGSPAPGSHRDAAGHGCPDLFHWCPV